MMVIRLFRARVKYPAMGDAKLFVLGIHPESDCF
jgi:hypothetical protein